MADIVLKSRVEHDEYTKKIEELFGLKAEESTVTIKDNIELPGSWNIGLIFGPSGAGKSTLLKKYGTPHLHAWNNKAIISNFTNVSPEAAAELLTAVGFSSVPAWLRPFHTLSVGEQFRANLARTLSEDRPLYVIDEFTSVVDRNVAKSVSNVLSKYVRKNNKRIVFASCHSDILEYLKPDWYYNPSEGVTLTGSDSLRRPEIPLEIIRVKYTAWELFKPHHYLTENLSRGARCFMALWEGVPVAFAACLAMPHVTLGYTWRASRTVVLPDYQGLGIGTKLADFIASMAKATGCKYYTKTVHPAMVSYRARSPHWRETDSSGKVKRKNNSLIERGWTPTYRRCASFEYVGLPSTEEEAKLFWDDAEFCQPKKRRAMKKGLITKGQGKYYHGSKRKYADHRPSERIDGEALEGTN